MQLARYDELDRVLAGIDAAAPLFPGFKIDTVVMRGVNDDELMPLVEFARARGAEVRFIEYMDVGGATRWSWDQVVTRADILAALAAHYGAIEADWRTPVGARRALSTAGRDGVRDHLVDDRAVLRRAAIAAV